MPDNVYCLKHKYKTHYTPNELTVDEAGVVIVL